MFLSNSVIIIP